MVTQSPDTSPDAERVQIEILRRMPAWQRLQMMDSLISTMRALVLHGLAQRYPDEPPQKLRRRLADLLLGPALAERAYGPWE